MNLRAAARLCWFAGEISVAVADYFVRVAFASARNHRAAQAAWLHRASRRHLRIFNYSFDVTGSIPRTGLLVSNHLSYFDVLAISAITPAVFVSKADVRRWPLFGWLASLAGTVFIERERRLQVGEINDQIKAVLADGVLVVIFPEGTSSNGETILPFRSPLLEPVVGGGYPITVGRLHYSVTDGDARNDVCYWGDHVFFPHVINLLGKRTVHATVRFAPFAPTNAGRKELARQLHAAVEQLSP